MSNTIKIKDMIKGAKLAERSVMICMDTGLTADMEVLERQLAELDRAPQSASLAGDPRRPVAAQIEALRAQMLEHSIEFRFRALPRLKFTALLAANPPREGNEGDRMLGANEDSVFTALVRACAVSPDLDEEDWAALLGEDGVLSSVQFDLLANTAWAVNRRDVDVPFSPGASRILRTSEDE